MKTRASAIWVGLGILFLLNAILGRYLVLPGYLSSLEGGKASLEAASQAIPAWKIVRYLVWAYSFKIGVFLVGIGVLLRTSIPTGRFRLLVGGGIVYLLLAYIPVPGPYPLFFGLGGSLITVLLVFILMRWASERGDLKAFDKTSADYRLIGYFFFAMATYNLCPLMGVKAFGLYPEKMIRFGLQTEAVSFASRIMIELVLGWFFIFLSHRKSPKGSR
ncbi:MAG: hypothetical protein HY787_01020 [Deltaproteobacteria bacterium]|nr:hypothetical protein [Deltaproteobacteria bacterium]